MPKEQSTNVIVEREALLKALLRASSLSQESDKKLVRMKIESDTIHLSANSEIGHVNDEVAAQNNGQTLEIAFNATFLTDILSRVGEESLLMQFKNSEVAGVFRPIHGDGFYYLVAPVKI